MATYKITEEEEINFESLIESTDNIKDLLNMSFPKKKHNITLNKKLILKLYERIIELEALVKGGKIND